VPQCCIAQIAVNAHLTCSIALKPFNQRYEKAVDFMLSIAATAILAFASSFAPGAGGMPKAVREQARHPLRQRRRCTR
jgi:hypothetical protein